MMKEEFQKLTTREFTDKEYEAIEAVYAFHPSISETEGKQQIATIWDTFGMRTIADMLLTAIRAREYEDRISKIKHELDELKNEFSAFKYPKA